MLDIAAAFLTGIASSGHCAGACSGIAVSLMSGHRAGRPGHDLLYLQAGRIASYAAAGAAVGATGGALQSLLGLAGLNQGLRLLAVASLIWTGLALSGFLPSPSLIDRWVSTRLTSGGRVHLVKAGHPFLLGAVWGAMPCGMVYMALLTAGFMGGPIQGAIYMAAFGLGTAPGLSAAALSLARLKDLPHRMKFVRRYVGPLIVLIALASLVLPGPLISQLFCG